MQAFYDGLTLIGSLVVMAALVVSAYYASRWYAGRMGRSLSGKHIKIVDRVSVSPGCSLIILQAGGRFYLIGLSDKNIRLICELDDFDPAEMEDTPARNAPFSQIFKGFLKKAENGAEPRDDGGKQ